MIWEKKCFEGRLFRREIVLEGDCFGRSKNLEYYCGGKLVWGIVSKTIGSEWNLTFLLAKRRKFRYQNDKKFIIWQD